MSSYHEELAQELAEETRREQEREAEAAKVAGLSGQDLINAKLVSALERLTEQSQRVVGPIPQVPFGQHRVKTTWNPTGEPHKRALSRSTFLNGHKLRERMLGQDEIDALNKVKAGSYRNGKWTVIERSINENGDSSVWIYFPNRTPEQRMETLQEGRTLMELLGKLLAEQESRQRVTLETA